MAKSTAITFDTVRQIGLALPHVEEGTTYGSPCLKLRGKLLMCIAIHRSAEPDTLAVRIGFDQRDDLLAADPDVFYLTNHYVNYPVVLARLPRIQPDELLDLLGMALRFVNVRPASRTRPARKRSSGVSR